MTMSHGLMYDRNSRQLVTLVRHLNIYVALDMLRFFAMAGASLRTVLRGYVDIGIEEDSDTHQSAT
eukprot:8396741-Ditylum_brightwellii.AAC.1